MTAAEFKAYFLAEYDAATSLSAPAWEDSEISSFLNIAQDSIVTELYKLKDLGKLAELLLTSEFACVPHGTIANGSTFELSTVNANSDYFYYIDSRTYTAARTNPTIANEIIPNELIDRSNASKFFLTSFNKPWFRNPKVYIDTTTVFITNTSKFIILVDGYTTLPVTIELTYIKRPVRIDITLGTTTELNESLHQTIVTLAVEQAVKSIKVAKISNQ